VPPEGESVADGAARQAAWIVAGSTEPPQWSVGHSATFEAEATPTVREAYAQARDLITERHV